MITDAAPPGTARLPNAQDEGDLSRVATLPNAITVLRLLVLAAFVGVLFGAGDRVTATVLLAVAGSTDFLDGYLARRLGQVSNLGKVIDPVADRLVLATAAVSVIVYGAVPLWLAAIVLGRELGVSLATLALAALGARRMDVVWFGKAGTFAMMVALPLLLLGDGPGAAAAGARIAAWVCVVPGELLLLAATALYLHGARQALADGRTARASVGAGVGPAGRPDSSQSGPATAPRARA